MNKLGAHSRLEAVAIATARECAVEAMTDEPTALPDQCTVLICDDRPELREAISKVLSDAARFRVVGEASDGFSCLQRVRETGRTS